jgi:hypothetical protein
MSTQLCEDGVMGICVGLITYDPAAPSLLLDGDPFFPRGAFMGFSLLYYMSQQLYY